MPEAWSAAREAVALAKPTGDSRELAMAFATLGRLELLDFRNADSRAHSELALGELKRWRRELAKDLGIEGDYTWSEHCDTSTGRLKMPLVVPPPCVPLFEGDNGGDTGNGVVFFSVSDPVTPAALLAVAPAAFGAAPALEAGE